MVRKQSDRANAGARIRELRRQREFTQDDVAAAVGISAAHLSRIERGLRRATLDVLRDLAKVLGVSIDYLESGRQTPSAVERELRLADAELALRFAEVPTEAESTLRELLKEAVEEGASEVELRVRVGLGIAAAHRGAFQEVVKRLDKLSRDSRVKPTLHPDVFLYLAQAYVQLGREDAAEQLLRQCLQKLGGRKHDAAYVRFAMHLSAALSDARKFEEAQAIIDSALRRTAKRETDPYNRARVDWSCARLAAARGDFGTARVFANRAIGGLETTEDTINLARSHLLGAQIALSMGRIPEAEEHLSRADQLNNLLDNQHRSGLRADQARVAAYHGDSALAMRLADEAAALAGDDPKTYGRAEWALAEAFASASDWEPALKAFARADQLLAPEGRFTAEVRESWARALDVAGRTREAQAMRRKATA